MKQSNTQIYNISEITLNNSLKTAFSLLKNNSIASKFKSRNLTCLNFPKLYSKIKYKRITQNNSFEETRHSNSNKKPKLNINKSLRIYNYPSHKKKQESTTTRSLLPKIENNKTSPHNYSRINHFNYLNSLNKPDVDYSSIFLSKRAKNNYTKYLSESYRKNTRHIINILNDKYKQKTDSILNMVEKNDGFYIKGMKYNRYFFYKHEKMNILLFHQKIMNDNIKRFQKRRKVQNLKIKPFENINTFDKRRSISTDDIFIQRAFNKRKTRKYFTRNFYTKNNLKNQIANMVDYETNKVMVNNKF